MTINLTSVMVHFKTLNTVKLATPACPIGLVHTSQQYVDYTILCNHLRTGGQFCECRGYRECGNIASLNAERGFQADCLGQAVHNPASQDCGISSMALVSNLVHQPPPACSVTFGRGCAGRRAAPHHARAVHLCRRRLCLHCHLVFTV